MSLVRLSVAVLGVVCTTSSFAFADEGPKDDFRPATSNQTGKQYPQVNSEGRARFRIVAPQAQRVSVGLGGRGGTPLTKEEDGAWTGSTPPLDVGFHYYSITIDGAQVPDPNSNPYYGASRFGSAIEIPSK